MHHNCRDQRYEAGDHRNNYQSLKIPAVNDPPLYIKIVASIRGKCPMMLCSICSGIDIRSLLPIFADESFVTKPYQEAEKFGHSQRIEGQIKHHDDIFGVRGSADNGCGLCAVIIKAFEGRKVEDENIARGMPIVFSGNKNNKLAAGIVSPEGLIELCGFDVYMHQGERFRYTHLWGCCTFEL